MRLFRAPPTPRWTRLRYHPVQHAYWTSRHRFNVVPAGRRSGKTETAKRRLVKRAIMGTKFPDARFFAGAPTRDQAKRIFWHDLKLLTPPNLVTDIREGNLIIRLINGAEIHVVGMDKPERIEGSPWDGGVLDEYGNMKAQAWGENVRPALSDRDGWCDLIGVPEGHNHYYDLAMRAIADHQELGDESEWAYFHWKSAEILPAKEIEAARRDLDPLTFEQEYEGSFVNFQGRCYYPFDRRTHCAPLRYDPEQPLILCFDFNVAPGVAAIIQEQKLPSGNEGTGVIGEVYIPRNSNTPAVCRKIAELFGTHRGRVVCYGDATGGSQGSAKVQGSDWTLIATELRPIFRDRLFFNIQKSNPPERDRVNAVNTRLLSGDKRIRLMVDPKRAPFVVKDFEGVRLLEGGSGEIDKKYDPTLSHLTDAIGYYVWFHWPVSPKRYIASTEVLL